jgi:hypothetical protein
VTLRYSQRHRGDPRFCSARNMRNAGVIGAPIIWLPRYVGLSVQHGGTTSWRSVDRPAQSWLVATLFQLRSGHSRRSARVADSVLLARQGRAVAAVPCDPRRGEALQWRLAGHRRDADLCRSPHWAKSFRPSKPAQSPASKTEPDAARHQGRAVVGGRRSGLTLSPCQGLGQHHSSFIASISLARTFGIV